MVSFGSFIGVFQIAETILFSISGKETNEKAKKIGWPFRAHTHTPKMLRQLKPHEQKLLKKVNLYDWKRENNVREIQILRRYRIQKREDYTKYALASPTFAKIRPNWSCLSFVNTRPD